MSHTANHPKKYPPRHYLFLAFAVLVSGYAIYLFYNMAHLPYSGEHSFFIDKEGSLEVRAVVLGEGETISVSDLPGNLIPAHESASIGIKGALPREMEEMERQRLLEALAEGKGNKSEAARILGLNRSTFYSKLRKLDML